MKITHLTEKIDKYLEKFGAKRLTLKETLIVVLIISLVTIGLIESEGPEISIWAKICWVVVLDIVAVIGFSMAPKKSKDKES